MPVELQMAQLGAKAQLKHHYYYYYYYFPAQNSTFVICRIFFLQHQSLDGVAKPTKTKSPGTPGKGSERSLLISLYRTLLFLCFLVSDSFLFSFCAACPGSLSADHGLHVCVSVKLVLDLVCVS